MRRFEFLLVLIAFFSVGNLNAAEPGCGDVLAEFDAVASKGKIKVPVTSDAQSPGKILDAVIEINRKFKAEEVAKALFDTTIDLPSQSRLLSEFRCFNNWKAQHDLYRKILKEHYCAHLRHKAVQLLEYDLCDEATVNLLVEEYKKSLYPDTKVEILKKLALSRDKKAIAVIDEALKSKSKALAKSAQEAKAQSANKSCMKQDPMGKPYYGLMDVASACEGGGVGEGSVLDTGGSAAGFRPQTVGAPTKPSGETPFTGE